MMMNTRYNRSRAGVLSDLKDHGEIRLPDNWVVTIDFSIKLTPELYDKILVK
jgi:hypothetical protein